jgi:hypothetical protein
MPTTLELRKLRCEFLAMPGLCLDVRQTARLLSVCEDEARSLLDALVDEGLLFRTAAGVYRRTQPSVR